MRKKKTGRSSAEEEKAKIKLSSRLEPYSPGSAKISTTKCYGGGGGVGLSLLKVS